MFEQGGGKIGAASSVLWMFKRKGLITVKTEKTTEEKLMEVALEAGAEDIATAGDVFEILTPPDQFDQVRKALAAAKIETEMSELRYIADNETDVDVKTALKVLDLISELDGHDDVNAVHSSLKMTDEIVAAMKAE
jgi:transcriptional/translational regulatory protein YebC/TACO1